MLEFMIFWNFFLFSFLVWVFGSDDEDEGKMLGGILGLGIDCIIVFLVFFFLIVCFSSLVSKEVLVVILVYGLYLYV